MKASLSFLGCLAFFAVSATGDSSFRASASADPRLRITNRGDGLIVSWPAGVTNLVLEQSPGLPPQANWTRVTSASLETNAGSVVWSARVAPGSAGDFFRLRALESLPGVSGAWSLDEGTGEQALDSTALGGTLFLSGVSWASGRIGSGSLLFHGPAAGGAGSVAWASNANYRLLPPAGQPFSLSLWFNPDALVPGWQTIAGNDSDGKPGWRVGLHTIGPGTNELFLAGAGANSLSLTGRTVLLPGVWRLLTVTYDGAAGSLFLDGALLARDAGTLPTHDGAIYFGGGLAGWDSFSGRVDEIRLRTNALTAEQASLKGHWQFDESAGGLLLDSGPEGHTALLTDGSARVAGRQGLGVDLTAGQIVISNSDLAVLPGSGGPFSISFWLRPAAMASTHTALMRCGSSAANGWQLTLEGETGGQNSLHWESRTAGGTLDLIAPLSFTNGAWTKIDLTYNGGIATMFVNGRTVATGAGAIQGSRGPIVLGSSPDAAAFPGVVDELKIFSRAREAWEVGPVALTMWETALRNTPTNLVLQGFGPVGKALTFAVLPLPASTNGTLFHGEGSGVVTYQAGNRKGPDAFAYVVSDGEFTSAPALVCVSVVEPHWLSVAGGNSSPQDGTDPAHAWPASSAAAVDAIWATNNFYDCFLYAPGLYQTRGWKYLERSSANPGCKHIGSGSSGPGLTTIQLVDIWAASAEETIFTPALTPSVCDDFEVQHLVLDCNAEHVPKYTQGEPVWIRIPLATTSRVDSLTVRWADTAVPGFNWWVGRAAEFSLCARRSGTNLFTSNCVSVAATSDVSVVPVGLEADELYLQLTRRGLGVDFYGVAEITVQGGQVSLPTATIPGGGESRLGTNFSILHAFDADPATAWASGPEASAQITVPLAPATAVAGLDLQWNCKSYRQPGQLGPAAELNVRAHDEITGLDQDVPFVRHGRSSNGAERITFEVAGSPREIITDRLTLILTARESGVQYYSLSEIIPLKLTGAIVPRLPAALSRLAVGDYSVLRAFDGDDATAWASSVQGMVGAVNVTGSNLKFIDLKIIGFGTKAGRECFVLAGNYNFNETPAHLGNVLIEDCELTDPAVHNRDGISAVSVMRSGPNTLTNSITRRTRVAGLKNLFTYSHAIQTLDIHFCEMEDCQVGVYWEPDRAGDQDVGAFLVRSNRITDVTYGIYYQFHSGAQYSAVTAEQNEFVLDNRQSWAFLACDTCDAGPSGSMTNATFLNNVIRHPGWVPQGGAGGLQSSDIRHALYANNIVALDASKALRVRACPSGVIFPPPPTEDCDHPLVLPPPDITSPPCLDALPAGYDRAWLNNRDLNGSLLPVRWLNLGIDGLASQQQYPE